MPNFKIKEYTDPMTYSPMLDITMSIKPFTEQDLKDMESYDTDSIGLLFWEDLKDAIKDFYKKKGQ
ncbi:MAG TPA: hypothetical protein VFM18_05080 [Methanosarcina sp.]|nr:hypothetical protein [Methanosarcina sp.]